MPRAAPRRRRPLSRRSFKGNGRQGFWFRQESFSPTDLDTSVGLQGDTLITPTVWERNVQATTQPKRKGGARLERVFCQFSMLVSYDATTVFQIIPAIEVLNYVDTSVSLPTSQGSYANRLQNQRVLWHRLYPATIRASVDETVINQVEYSGMWEAASKTRLTDTNVHLIFNSFFDHGGTGITDVTTLVVYTGYISTP